MPDIRLSAGTIDYLDTGGAGPTLVLLHGVLSDASLWQDVVAELAADHRCIAPTLPLGSHRRAMDPDADLSPRGVARITAELIDRLELPDVTLVGNDTGGALAQLLVAERPELVDRLVLTSCDAFDNFPPGLPGRTVVAAAHLPGGLYLAAQTLRVPFLRRLPMTFGWMAKRPIPAGVADAWFGPVRDDAGVRRDMGRLLRAVDRRDTLGAADALRAFDRPALVVWASEDRVMPREHGRRLTELLPDARLVELADCYTLLPWDQPAALAAAVRAFVRDRPVADDRDGQA